MKTCLTPDCNALTEGKTDFCPRHNRMHRKVKEQRLKDAEKREALLSKPQEPRKKISKNPKDWSNTFLCSDGTRITQAEIITNLTLVYSLEDDVSICLGCGKQSNGHAHVISQARCKVIGKTELIWDIDNFFKACNSCNTAIENPKGEAWKKLKNIDECIQFIYQHDKELYYKFEAQGWQAKIETNHTI